jgi:hypothetical protein
MVSKKRAKRQYSRSLILDLMSDDVNCRNTTTRQPYIPKNEAGPWKPTRSRITTLSRNRTEWHRLTCASSGVLYITGIVSSTWISSKRPTLALPNVFLLEFTDRFRQHSPRKIPNIRVHRTTRSKQFMAGLLLPVNTPHVHIASVTVLESRARCRWRACFWPDATRFQADRQSFPHCPRHRN